MVGETGEGNLQAPVGVMTVCIRGKVKLRIPATEDSVSYMSNVNQYSGILPKVLLMQTAQAIPCSRWMVGKTSAEYWNATGPSPME